MQRTKYFNHTRPSETQLNYTESSRVDSMLTRARAFYQFGVVEGFQIGVNGTDQTKIDVAAGEGYTGGQYLLDEFDGASSGERISTITHTVTGSGVVGTSLMGIGLADYTNGVKNYVSLVYTELESIPLSERTYPFTSHDTIVTETYTISVLTETDWNALSAASLNERVLLGIVTAKGAGTALTLADIDQFVQPKTHPSPTQPTTITGVTIIGVEGSTKSGTGTLRYVASTKTLYWTAPSDAEGIGVTVSNAGQHTLYSSDITYYIVIDLVFSSLPTTNLSDTITVNNLYGRKIPLACAMDVAHRDLVGTGIATVNNPHGLSMADITGGSTESDDLLHVNGIAYEADPDQLLCAISVDKIEVTNLGGQRNSFLIDGQIMDLLNGYTAGSDGIIDFDISPVPTEGDYIVLVDSAGTLQTVLMAGFSAAKGRIPVDGADYAVLDDYIEVVDMYNATAGDFTITWTLATRSLTYAAHGEAAGAAVYVHGQSGMFEGTGYYKLYSSDTDHWVIVRLIQDPGSASYTCATEMTDINCSKEGFLKLGVACWNTNTGSKFLNMRDIRKWLTADTSIPMLEEHDRFGAHTVPMKNTLTVEVSVNDAIQAFASNKRGINAIAFGSTAGYFYAKTDFGVVATAANAYGVYGQASNLGVYGLATNNGGYFRAYANTAVYATATGSYGVYGRAGTIYGGYFTAPNSALAAVASANTDATMYCASFSVNNSSTGTAIGAYGIASATNAPLIGMYGSALASGTCNITAGYFHASNEKSHDDASAIGVFAVGKGACGVGVGVYASATASTAAIGVSADATSGLATGVYGTALGGLGAYGVYGVASGANLINYGVYGSASDGNLLFSPVGVYGVGSNPSDEAKAVGVWGACPGAGATGVAGYGTAGTGVKAVGATALYCDGLIVVKDKTTGDVTIQHYIPVVVDGTSGRIAIFDT